MRHLLLLVAMVAAGQTWPVHADGSGWPFRVITCPCCKPDSAICCSGYCIERVPLPYEYRIDWLRPDLDLRPTQDKYDLGSPAYGYARGFNRIYLYAPWDALVVLLPNGNRVTISRAELEGRAK